MPNLNKNEIQRGIIKTTLYLTIIAVLLIALCIQNVKLLIPSIIIYSLVLIYTFWSNSRSRTEISKHIQEITGNVETAAKNSMANSPFPLILIETDGNIVWKNFKFNNEFANVDIKNVLIDIVKEIKNELDNRKDRKEKSIEKKVEIAKKTYKILGEYVKTKQKGRNKQTVYTLLLYFIDETEYLNTLKELNDQKTCVGILKIDNYEETMQTISTENRPQVIAQIEKNIYDWSMDLNAMMIKTEKDTYVCAFDNKYLDKIKENKFEILDNIKKINIEGIMQITLTIAISNEGETNGEKYKSAISTMDVALGRGGDQAVVKENGKYEFFGGRTLEIEKRTKVKARIVAHALEELMEEAEDVLVMGHTNGDIDSIGSSMGIYRFAKNIGKDVHIVNNTFGLSLSSFIENVKSEEAYKDVFYDKQEAISKITSKTLLVIVDTHKRSYVEVPELLEKTNKIVLIDHHRISTDYIDNAVLTFHEVYASSAAELVTELLQYAKKEPEITKLEAESLYGGIMVDTKNFTFKTGVRTFEAAAFLRKCGIDIIKIKKWFQSDLQSYTTIADIVKKAEILNGKIALSIYDKEDKDANVICAKAADELLTINTITASFVIGNLGDIVCVSGRSLGDINVQVILEKLGGGGHITLAGAQVEGKTCEEVKEELIIIINDYFNVNSN